MATATAPASENPKQHSDLNSEPPETEEAISTLAQESSDGIGDESKSKSVETAETNSGSSDSGAVNIQKKMKRAERFGMPVQLSEQEKRNSRAERFATGSAAKGLGSSKPSEAEELKRKARAERFGIVQSDPSEEETKKKARLARFGSLCKTDSAEEDKKKARAIRFSQLDSVKKGNAKGDIDVNKAIAGKAGGGT